MRNSLFILALAAALSATHLAQSQLPIPSAGVVPEVPTATDKPDPSRTYKIVFDVRSMPDSAEAVNPALVGIAKIINTYRKAAVPADHIQAIAVFHGPTIVTVVKDETYHGRTGAKANPNAELLHQLSAAGVKLVVCGVSAREQN